MAGGGAILLGAIAWRTHNRLVALDERCRSAFADVDALLKHRHSVLPNLVETVRGYMNHERGVITDVLNASVAAAHAVDVNMRGRSEGRLSQSINTLIASAENYPELIVSADFRTMRAELLDMENRITAARRYHNLTVNELNATARQFPGSLIAGMTRVGRREPFDLGLDRMLIDEPQAISFS